MNPEKASEHLFENLKWDENGLIPCVVQEAEDGDVLMVAYMNRESLEKTLSEKKACYWSRSRKKLWLKGEESGNFQEVQKVSVDCDGDCILLQVEQIGGAACHTGMQSCFYRSVAGKDKLVAEGERIFDPSKVYKK